MAAITLTWTRLGRIDMLSRELAPDAWQAYDAARRALAALDADSAPMTPERRAHDAAVDAWIDASNRWMDCYQIAAQLVDRELVPAPAPVVLTCTPAQARKAQRMVR